MSRTFKGRVVLSGAVKGEAAVSRQGFNTLATYYAGMADRSPCVMTRAIRICTRSPLPEKSSACLRRSVRPPVA